MSFCLLSNTPGGYSHFAHTWYHSTAFRYPLLLKQLCKHTPASHPDYTDLALALVAMQSVADHVNRIKGRIENMQVGCLGVLGVLWWSVAWFGLVGCTYV